MVLLTVRTHGPVTQIMAIYRTVRLTSVGFLTTTKVLDKDQFFNIGL